MSSPKTPVRKVMGRKTVANSDSTTSVRAALSWMIAFMSWWQEPASISSCSSELSARR